LSRPASIVVVIDEHPTRTPRSSAQHGIISSFPGIGSFWMMSLQIEGLFRRVGHFSANQKTIDPFYQQPESRNFGMLGCSCLPLAPSFVVSGCANAVDASLG